MACQADKMACQPKRRVWACDATKIHAHARNKPIGEGASHELSVASHAHAQFDAIKQNGLRKPFWLIGSKWACTHPFNL
jgi:hypothetical protein